MKSVRQLLPPQSDDLAHLDLLRFIASLGIVVHHSKEFLFHPTTRAQAVAASQGLSIFVDLFFVISGFVIAYAYHAKVGSISEYGRYLKRRFARLVPLHWLTFGLSVLVYAGIAAAGVKVQHVIPFDPACMASTLALAHSFALCGGGESFNGVSWSLSAELVMYVIFPVLLAAAVHLGRFALHFATGMSLLLCGAWAARHGAGLSALQWAELSPPLRAVPAFFFGICLFFSQDVVAKIPAARPMLWASLVLLLGLMVSGAPAIAVVLAAYVTVLLAVAADAGSGAGPFVRATAPLGQLTYSMYLIHPTVILVLMNGLGDKVLKLAPAGMAALAVISYAVIFISSYLSLVYFETPARRRIERLPIAPIRAPSLNKS